MQKEKKIYCGSGKKQNDTWFKVNLNFDELAKYTEEYMGKKYVKININVTEPDKFGKTISVTIDTWKPEAKTNFTPKKEEVTDLPF